MSLSDHPSGFVFEDKHFVCDDHSDEEIMNWTRSVMQSSTNGMPIALWLIHEQNKDKTMMSAKK